MCTETRACIVHVMDHLSDLVVTQLRLAEHPELGPVPRIDGGLDFMKITISVEAANEQGALPPDEWLWGPKMLIQIEPRASVSAAQLWTWVDTVAAGLFEAVIRVQANIDHYEPWTTAEIKDAMSRYEEFKQQNVNNVIGNMLAHLKSAHSTTPKGDA